MSESQFGPRENEADDQTRMSYPQGGGSQAHSVPQVPQPAQPQQSYPGPQARQPAPQGYGPYQGAPYGPGQQPIPSAGTPRKPAGYFRSLFDLSYDNLGAAKFARVFQLLFMIVSGLAVLVVLLNVLQHGSMVLPLLGIVMLPLLWLLLNTLVRLLLEAVVGIVQTAENSEEMLEILRSREHS